MTVQRLIEILLTCPQELEVMIALDGALMNVDAIAEYRPDGPGYDPVIGIEPSQEDV